MKTLNMKKTLLAASISAVLTGCNVEVSQDEADTATASKPSAEKHNGEGVSTGVVTKKSNTKVTVNGIQFDLSQANINMDGQTGQAADVKQGQVVTIKANYNSDGTAMASELEYDDSIEGPVDSVDQGKKQIVVMGQTVLVDASTILDGVDLATLAKGDIIEVSGTANAEGNWVASYIAKADQSLSEFNLEGSISDHDAENMTFKINGLLVDYSDIGNIESLQALLVDTNLLDFYGSLEINSDGQLVLRISEFELEDDWFAEEGDLREIEGIVTKAIADNQFEVNGVTVHVDDETYYEFGSAASLELNAEVEVEGILNEDGSVTAFYVFIEPENEVELAAKIEAIDVANNTVTVLGKTYHIQEDSLLVDVTDEMEDEHDGSDSANDDEAESDAANDEDWDDHFDDAYDDEFEGEYDDAFENTLELADLKVGDYIELVAYDAQDGQTANVMFLGRFDMDNKDEVYLSAQIQSVQTDVQSITVNGITVDLKTPNIELYVFDFEDEWMEDEGEISDEHLEELAEGELTEEENDATEISVETFLSHAEEGVVVELMGLNNDGTITWQVAELEVDDSDEDEDDSEE